MNSTLKNLLLVSGGLAAGLAAGILTAPKSGKETRKDILYKIDELKSKLEGLTGKARKKIEQQIENLKQSLAEMEIEIK